MKILYLGNKQYKTRKVRTVLETLEPLFKEFGTIKTYSDKNNIFLRYIDMVIAFFRFGFTSDKIIIDVYSTKAFYYAFTLSILSAVFRRPYILFLHGGDLPKRFNRNPRLVTLIFKKSNAIVAPSKYLKTFFEMKGFSIHFIPNIIELEKYEFKKRDKIRPSILYLRGFSKIYNPLLTLQAINSLKKKYHELKVLMYGNKSDYYYPDVKDFIKKNNLDKIVTVREKVEREIWIKESVHYDIMISNPEIDNTPISIIEGMALGMIIISSNVGGIPFLLTNKKDGFIMNNYSPNELHNCIDKIISNSINFTEISVNARKSAEKFTWDEVKQEWKNILS